MADKLRPWRKLYSTKQWYRLRHHQLQKEPCCEYCDKQGYVTAATIVDHIVPHKGNEALFFDPDNLQSLCKEHHDNTKQREERSNIDFDYYIAEALKLINPLVGK